MNARQESLLQFMTLIFLIMVMWFILLAALKSGENTLMERIDKLETTLQDSKEKISCITKGLI